jgi:spermidine dehydrogenase
MKEKIRPEDKELGLDTPITRRDFVGGTLIGAGAGLMAATPKGLLAGKDISVQQPGFSTLGPDWTGPGGIGDYALANGNTHEVVNTAHALRDDRLEQAINTAEDVDGIYDLVIVGGGFSGFGAAYAFKEKTGDNRKCLILDNHAMFGGEAKQNEFIVDGYRLYGPQGSNSFVVHTDKPSFPELWYKLDLPTEFEFEELSGTDKDIRFAPDSFGPMMKWPESASTGYFYDNGTGGKWVMDAHRNGFRDAPISESFRRELNDVLHNRIKPEGVSEDWEKQFDSMTYHEFLVNKLNVSKDVLYKYIDPYFGSAAFGASGDAISAYAAYKLQMPGTIGHLSREQQDAYNNRSFYSFPGGNSTILRRMVKDGSVVIYRGTVQWKRS